MIYASKYTGLSTFLMAALFLTTCGGGSPQGPKMDVPVNVPGGDSDLQLFQILEPPFIDYSQLTVEARKGRRNCAINRPSSNAKIVNINSYTSSTRRGSPINAVNARLNRDTQKWRPNVSSYYRSKIIITDTSAPIFVVAGTYENTVWEVYVAPGVKLDGMVLIGHEAQAVVNTNIKPSRISFISKSDPLHKKCYHAANRDGDSANKDKQKAYKDWRRYLSRKLGRAPSETVNDYGIDAALIGPVPDFALPGAYGDPKIIRHDADDRTLIINSYDHAEAQAIAWIDAGKTDF